MRPIVPCLMALLALTAPLSACGGDGKAPTTQLASSAEPSKTVPPAKAAETSPAAEAAAATATAAGDTATAARPDPMWPIRPYDDPHAVITLVGGAQVVIELEKELAPNTVENYIRLAEQKFYDGTVFHRVIPGFMAQGGSPEGKGQGGPGWKIDLEIHPNLRHVRGSVAMARTRDPNSAGSQFYLCYKPQPALDDGRCRSLVAGRT